MQPSTGENRLGRGFVALTPVRPGLVPFEQIAGEPGRHHRLLTELQRLRGRIYLQDGAILEDQLTPDGRHVQPADDVSWHLLTVDRDEHVTGCIRYRPHAPGAEYRELSVPEALVNQSPDFAAMVESAVRSELVKANQLGFSYVELGGWVVGEELRCSTEAIRMLLMMYSLSQLLGGAIALSTATRRHNSSSILRRTGGMSLWAGSTEIPAYFDTAYNCEMEMVSFDSRSPNPRYEGWIREFRQALLQIPMISPVEAAQRSEVGMTSSLLELNTAVGPSVEQREPAFNRSGS